MKLSMRWLSDFYPINVSIDQYISDLTMSGSKVEGYVKENDSIKNILVGKVLEIEKHPDADTLIVCQLDVGSGELVQIVTGANNVKVGDVVPVALHKSLLPNGTKITKGKLRGVASNGMLCSLSELGLTKEDFPRAAEDGIFLLHQDLKLGELVEDAIGLNDTIVEFEITSNRPDCMSVSGLARETAATYGEKLNIPDVEFKSNGSNIQDHLSVTVENTQLCKRYMAAVVENVKIKHSPRWLRERLRASGIRPINNIVDITNYVMLETGYPMHAFDLRHVADNKIIVRSSKDGETITTLDGIEHKLSPEMLVIADGKEASAVAGVMGGEYSGVYNDTKTIVFEAASFDGPSVRKTSKKLGIRTESSGRFEKGLDSRGCEVALKRACQLIEVLESGDVCKGFIDEDFDTNDSTIIHLDYGWINSLIGMEIPRDDMIKILENLDFKVDDDNIIVPYFRKGDVLNKYDIAEEIARIYGYDKIPTTVIRGEAKALVSHEQKYRNNINNLLTAAGYTEIKTYSFFSPSNYDKISLPADDSRRNSVVIRNPLGIDTSILRTTAIPSMLMILASNHNNRNQSASMFEIASVYLPTSKESLPEEPKKIIMGEYGKICDFYTLKGGVETLLDGLNIKNVNYTPLTDNPSFHPGRCATLYINGKSAGVLGQIHPSVAANYEVETEVFLAELDYSVIYESINHNFVLKSLPKFPASTRDLALVCDKAVTVGEIEKIIRKASGNLLESINLFDVYQGAQVEENKKSLAFALTFRGGDRTLTDEECDRLVEKSLNALKEIDVSLRT